MYIPPGFGTVTPYLFVHDAERLLAFLVDAFAGVETLRNLRPDGKVANAQIVIGTTTLMASEASTAYPPMPASYYLYVADAEATTARAVEHGATLVMALADMPYGDRQSGVRDPCGNLWWISQRLVEAPYA